MYQGNKVIRILTTTKTSIFKKHFIIIPIISNTFKILRIFLIGIKSLNSFPDKASAIDIIMDLLKK